MNAVGVRRVVLAVVIASGFAWALRRCWAGLFVPTTYLPFRRYRR